MAALLRQGARRMGGSVLQRTQAAVTSPAVAEERRRLVPRRMYSAGERFPMPSREYLEKEFGHLKPHQICWEFIKSFPAGKVVGFVAMASGTVAFVSATKEVKLEREEAEKKRAQSASTELKQQLAQKN